MFLWPWGLVLILEACCKIAVKLLVTDRLGSLEIERVFA
ncbi:hypothetical protein cgp_3238 [Corynebacterium glutamicum MB001]|nr:hypothetical protein cgp_3238 [Corynebacterium glutamicum MB001]ASW15218.1 hypothetical protein cgc1_3238 [Corynebacterium glutamicum]QYO74878.1 hypothetical protein cgisf_3238 [Corynebacterium glutamicum]CAF20951.1 hypothetical protein predicted by Glimmer/Critica [Corynebacterium glutamicum ATCC 13032]